MKIILSEIKNKEEFNVLISLYENYYQSDVKMFCNIKFNYNEKDLDILKSFVNNKVENNVSYRLSNGVKFKKILIDRKPKYILNKDEYSLYFSDKFIFEATSDFIEEKFLNTKLSFLDKKNLLEFLDLLNLNLKSPENLKKNQIIKILIENKQKLMFL